MLKPVKIFTNLGWLGAARVFLLALALAVLPFPGVSRADPMFLDGPRVDKSFLLNEARLTLSGRVDEGCQVIIKVVGSGKKVVLGNNGLLPSNYAIVDNLPGLYRVIGSGSLRGFQPGIEEYTGIKDRAAAYSWSNERKVTLTGQEKERQIQKAVSLKEQSGSYRFTDSGVIVQDGKFKATLVIGRQEYTPQVEVEVLALRDNNVVDRKSRTVDIKGSLLVNGPLDIEKEPVLFAGIFFCLTVIAALGAEEILGRKSEAA